MLLCKKLSRSPRKCLTGQHEEDKVHSLGELIGHLRSKEMKFWNIIEKEERLVIVHIVDDEAPWLKYSVCVKGDMSVTLHVMKTAVRKLGANLVVPEIADSKNDIVELLEGIEKWDGDLMSDSVAEICEAVCLLLDQLSTPHAEDDGGCIRFLREQRQVVTELTLHLLANEEPSDFDACENGHTSESVLKHILRCSTNILLKNFCGKLNDKLLDAADKAKKRKATTLQNK
ncbi:hypothetical protein HPB48_026804 [Haemaphysalis longicornis]|uniref:Uncharacterized protein n=1 Tax=Haemaphysalis longicornis TaxID=44386 RepID=A0A9J6HAE8_HAELO|nr:hypothetical protein HPB48_026804 [Haemaphysalis longicornis]